MELTRPTQLHQLRLDLPSRSILHEHSASNSQIPIPPSAVQCSGVRCNAQLHISCLSSPGADRFKASGQSINMACDHRNPITGFIVCADREGNQ